MNIVKKVVGYSQFKDQNLTKSNMISSKNNNLGKKNQQGFWSDGWILVVIGLYYLVIGYCILELICEIVFP